MALKTFLRTKSKIKIRAFGTFTVFKKDNRSYSFDARRELLKDAVEQCKSNDIEFVPLRLRCKSNDIEFVPLRLRQYVLGDRFSNAKVDTVQYLEDIDGCVRDPASVTKEEIDSGTVNTGSVKFSSLFHRGFDCFQFQNEHGGAHLDLIEDPLLIYAIQSFVYEFLLKKDHHENCLRTILITSQEDRIATVLANHLFSRLAVNTPSNSYFVTNDHDKYGRQFHSCPCISNCGDKIWYGNSGIGTELLWYGKPDIMVFPFGGSCCIVLAREKKDNSEMYTEQEKEIIEAKRHSKLLREDTNVSQFVSQVITSSFYQKQFQLQRGPPDPTDSVVTLIPTVAICDRCFDVYMYDTENDILLRNDGDPIPLWNSLESSSGATLNMGAVLLLWMVVNHLSIKPYFSEADLKMLHGTCGFTTTLPKDHIKRIERDVKMKTKFLDREIREITVSKSPSLKSKILRTKKPP